MDIAQLVDMLSHMAHQAGRAINDKWMVMICSTQNRWLKRNLPYSSILHLLITKVHWSKWSRICLVESLLKSEVISDDVRRLLLEIMFAGVNHSLISCAHAMLPALTVIVPIKITVGMSGIIVGGFKWAAKSRENFIGYRFARGYGAASVISCTKWGVWKLNISDMSVVPVSTQSYVKSSAEPSQSKLIFLNNCWKMKHPPVTPVLYYRRLCWPDKWIICS